MSFQRPVFMLTWIHYLVIFGIAFGTTILLVPPVRTFAIKHKIVDEPGPRRVNRRTVPRLGGVAMFGGLVVAVFVEYVFEMLGVWHGPLYIEGEVNFRSLGVMLGLFAIVIVGIIDDVRSLKPGWKFLGQVAASCIIVGTGTVLHTFQLPGSSMAIDFGLWAYPITVVYLVCFINIINLIDGLDGLAAGITGMAAITLFVMFMTLLQVEAALLAVITAAIACAFLIYNFYPASIFMGDSGSMLLGLLLGTVSLVGTTRLLSITLLIVPIIVALIPIIDTGAAIVRRLRRHESIATPDSGHIHHRLLRRGYSQRKAVLLIYLWTAMLCVGTILMWIIGGPLKIAIFIILLIPSAVIVYKLGLFRPVRQRHGKDDTVYDTSGIDPDNEGEDGSC